MFGMCFNCLMSLHPTPRFIFIQVHETLKVNIATQNSHSWKELPFTNHHFEYNTCMYIYIFRFRYRHVNIKLQGASWMFFLPLVFGTSLVCPQDSKAALFVPCFDPPPKIANALDWSQSWLWNKLNIVGRATFHGKDIETLNALSRSFEIAGKWLWWGVVILGSFKSTFDWIHVSN